ncbi:phytoene/squalene synthase family protein [uncultured Enterovirga sp.]|uniref:phytoene/squalene synthase family protein n=1 Tax=uncultured Enterovirga sp. TaxID=2026352 RepID=UPI0035CA91A3
MPAEERRDVTEDYGHCETLLREADRDRYWSALFAPADKRPHLFALYAFSTEIARVREAVSAPMPGEIRLQWWRDAVEGLARGDVMANPVAAALEDTIARFSLPRQAFIDLIDARVFDLYDDPMPSLGDLEGYLGETSSSLMRLATLVLADGRDPGGADAAGHAGIAYGLTGLLRALPWHARQGRLYLPRDLLDRHGVTRDDIVLGRGGPGVVTVLADLRERARTHLATARSLQAALPAAIRPAFLPAALVASDLAAMDRSGLDPLATPAERPAWRRLASLWWGSKRGF